MYKTKNISCLPPCFMDKNFFDEIQNTNQQRQFNTSLSKPVFYFYYQTAVANPKKNIPPFVIQTML